MNIFLFYEQKNEYEQIVNEDQKNEYEQIVNEDQRKP